MGMADGEANRSIFLVFSFDRAKACAEMMMTKRSSR